MIEKTTKDRIASIVKKFNDKLAKHHLSIETTFSDAEKKDAEKEALMSEAILDNGMTIYTPASEFAEGAEVFTKGEDGTMQPLQDGDYTSADGAVFTVAEGKISKITTSSPEKPEVEEVESTEMSSNDILKQIQELINSAMDTQLSAIKAEMSKISAKVNQVEQSTKEVQTKMSVTAAIPSVKEVRQTASTGVRQDLSKMSTVDRVKAMIDQNKNV